MLTSQSKLGVVTPTPSPPTQSPTRPVYLYLVRSREEDISLIFLRRPGGYERSPQSRPRGRGLFSLAQPLLSTTWLYWNWVGTSESWEWIRDGYSWPADSANWNHPRIRGLGNFNINISAAVFVMGQERAGEMTHAWPLLNLPNTRPWNLSGGDW